MRFSVTCQQVSECGPLVLGVLELSLENLEPSFQVLKRQAQRFLFKLQAHQRVANNVLCFPGQRQVQRMALLLNQEINQVAFHGQHAAFFP